MQKKKQNGIFIKQDAGNVADNISFFNKAMGSESVGEGNSSSEGTTSVGEALNEETKDIYYHGSTELIKSFNSRITVWLSNSEKYSLMYATNNKTKNGYLYTCKVNLNSLNLLDCGETGKRVYSALFSIPLKISPALKEIFNKLNLSEAEQQDLLNKVQEEYDATTLEKKYALRIDVVTRSYAFRKVLLEKGYDGVSALERGLTARELVSTWGVYNSNAIEIVDTKRAILKDGEIKVIPLNECLDNKESINTENNLGDIVDLMFKTTNKLNYVDKPLGKTKVSGDEIHLYYWDKNNFIYANVTKGVADAYVLNGKAVRLNMENI